MKKLIGVLVLSIFALALTAQSALADGTTITFTGSYSSDSNSSLFSAPDGTFSFSFDIPSTFSTATLVDGFITLNTSVDLFGSGVSQPGIVVFAPSDNRGGFDIDVSEEGVTYSWTAVGPQLYILNSGGTTATLIPNGSFDVVPSPNIFSRGSFFSDTNGDLAPISSGIVTLFSSVPEPSALYY
jgi:hypothetical protein